MKKNFILCLVAFCAVLFTGCKEDNPAEAYVGSYNLTVTPHLTVTAPMIGTIELPTAPYTVSCTIALDGDEGKVIATTDLTEDLMHGVATEEGLQFDPINASMTYHLDDFGDFSFTGVVTFPLVTFPDGVNATWESTVTGTATLSTLPVAVPTTGTATFHATKLAQ